MFRKTGLTMSVICLCLAIAGVPAVAADTGKTPAEDMTVWFDHTGAYHCGGLVEYMNDVLGETKKDPEFAEVLKVVLPGRKKVTVADLPKIGAGFNPLKHTAAVYISGADYLQAHAKTVKDAFQTPAEASGVLTIKSFGIQGQGNIGMIQGSTPTNLLLAVPADPVMLASATNASMNTAPVMETVFLSARESADWISHAQRSQVMATGVSNLFNLHPGPWIIYMNQNSVIVQCYRVIIAPGSNNLTADQICFRPRLGTRTDDTGDKPAKK